MSASAPPLAARPALAAWGPTLLGLGLGVLGWAWLFREEVAHAVRTWNDSTAYNHCWLVLPIAGWLAWQRRDRLSLVAPRAAPWIALAVVPLAAGWLLAERLGIMEGRQLAAIALLQVLIAAVLGLRLTRAMAAPLLYLVFLVPFGAFAVPLLQEITLRIILVGLNLLGTPHYVEGLIIDTPNGAFHVAEACAGLRFIIAAVAFGALYAFTIFRSPGRRLVVMLLAVAVPVFANGLRALGIVVLAQYLGSAEAAAADHLIYGWVFFSAVLLLLVMAGLPFRQDGQARALPPADERPPGRLGPALGAAALALALAATGPAVARRLDGPEGARGSPIAAALTPVDGCVATSDPALLRCPDALIRATLIGFPGGVTWNAVAAERRRLAGVDDEAVGYAIVTGDGTRWEVRQERARPGPVAVAAWLGGASVGDGVRTRALQARNSLSGGALQPVLAMVAAEPVTAGATTPVTGMDPARLRAILEAQTGGFAQRGRSRSTGAD